MAFRATGRVRPRRGRGRRVVFEGEAGELLQLVNYEWQCDPDPAEILGAAAVATDEEDHTTQAPDAILYFRTEDGGTVSIAAHFVWKSNVVRDLVDLSGTCEEIPLPNSSIESVIVFLGICESCPQLLPNESDAGCLRSLSEDLLREVFWVAKLFNMYNVLAAPVVDLLLVREHLLHILPVEIVYFIIKHPPDILTDSMLLSLFEKIVSDRTQKLHPAMVIKLIAPFMASRTKQVRDGALQSLEDFPAVEANVFLLRHREYCVRSRAIRRLKQRESSEDVAQLLASLASNSSFLVKESVAQALKAVAPENSLVARQVFVEMLKDRAREVRRAAAEGLKCVADYDDPFVVSKTMAIVMDAKASEPCRCDALSVLAVLAPSHKDVVQDMARSLQDGSTMAKRSANRVLELMRLAAELDDEASSSPLASTTDTSVATSACRAGHRIAARQLPSWADSGED